MRSLYPQSEPFAAGYLPVGQGHEIFVEQSGNPSGIPVLFLHGGPGAGCKDGHRQFFDPARYHVILFDQRGAGRSRPRGEVTHNSTPELVEDIERIRRHAGIERCLLFGGSWGACLALAYAEAHPDRVLGMVLRGAFLARPRDKDWFFHDGAARLLPAQWHAFTQAVACPPGRALADHLWALVSGEDDFSAERAARAWAAWSGAVVTFSIDAPAQEPDEPLEVVLAKTRIEMHYARHRYFLEDDQLLANAHRLPRVPVTIVHGQRDLTCPAEAAWALHRAIPDAKLVILRTAGHLSGEGPTSDALLDAADAMARRFGN